MGGATAMGAVQKHPDRFDRLVICDTPGQSTPASTQQWEERIASAQKGGMQAQVESTIAPLVSAGDGESQPAASRRAAQDDPGDAGERLRRLLGRARQSRLPARHEGREEPGALHVRREGRPQRRRDAADAEGISGGEIRRAARRRPHLQHGSARRCSPRRCGISSPPKVVRASPAARAGSAARRRGRARRARLRRACTSSAAMSSRRCARLVAFGIADHAVLLQAARPARPAPASRPPTSATLPSSGSRSIRPCSIGE